MAIYRNIEAAMIGRAGATGGMQPFLTTTVKSPNQLDQPDVAEFISSQIQFLIRRADEELLPLSLAMAADRVDSLVAIKLRNWWK